ncbi:alpha/beta fold hydrolase [Larkinella soli]|uniref:alpha/beta fold hydrolase n=1 Tax=Larkinella soli TaxID=1770527 RepID=UPI000FFB3A65|nr:alpha/beta hydrolase [Larkinella soli]
MATAGTIEVRGFRFGYRIDGEGTPVLVIGSSVYYPRTFQGRLHDRLQLIHIDHRGFVPPPSPDLTNEDYRLEVLLDDFEAVRQALGLEKFIVMGHSGHAFMALEYAKKYPQYVTHVVLIAASPDFSEESHRLADDFFDQEADPGRKAALDREMARIPDLIEAAPERRFVAYCLGAGPRSWYEADFDAAALWEDVYTNMAMIDFAWGEVFRDIDITTGLEQFDKPVLLLLGRYDFLIGPPSMWDRVRSRFRNLSIEVLEKSAHTPQLEESERFNTLLLQWLETTPPVTLS